MPRRPRIPPFTTLAAELAWAVPQVVAHRLARMAVAGAAPSPRDRREFALMNAEKNDAFHESWAAMTAQTLHVQQTLVTSLLRSIGLPPPSGASPPAEALMPWNDAALGVLRHGMVPVHRRAVANAKRLGRTKLR